MNPKSIFKLFSPKRKVQTVVQQGVSTLLMSAVALSLLALTVCAQVVLADEPAASGQPGLEALPTGVKNEVDPDQDIGLFEFFSPGYGAQIVMPTEAEVLPTMVKGEVDPDSDIGLLEFFTMPNKTTGQRAIERKADEDIGLVEFFKPQAPALASSLYG
jgi:hypothetical protein